MVEWKEKFLERYGDLTDIDEFLEASLKPMRKSIRVNTLKTTVVEMKKRLNMEQVPWCKEGFFVEGKGLGNLKEHFLGYFYLQGAASMIPPVVLQPKPGDKVLDMCAAPGSKTSQMAAMMENQGILIANDHKLPRLKPLSINLQRCGVANTVITQMEGYWFKNISFDKILVDAPCSGIGTIRKSYQTIQMWNPLVVKQMCGVQKKLLFTAVDLLKKGGSMIYSTCTLEPEENEKVVSTILDERDDIKTEKIELKIKRGKPVTEFQGETYNKGVKNCLRIWPQDNDTEGFFVTKLIKK